MFHTILPHLQDHKNMAMIMRSHAAFGGDQFILFDQEAIDLDHKKIKSISRSMNEQINFQQITSFKNLIKWKKDNSCKFYSIEIDENAKDLYNFQFDSNAAFILGHEISGVATELMNISDEILRIPQFGNIGSMNVSIAASIAMYEYNRSRKNPKRIIGNRYNYK